MNEPARQPDIWSFLIFVNHPECYEVSVNRDRSFNVRETKMFPVKHMQDDGRFVQVGGLRKHLLRFFGLQAIVMPWGRCYVVPEGWNDSELQIHEGVHFDQLERMGPVKFTLVYCGYHIRYGYRRNPMEIEAYAVSDAYARDNA